MNINKWSRIFVHAECERINHLIDDLRIQLLSAPLPCGLCDVCASLRRRKSVSHSLQLHMKMLLQISTKWIKLFRNQTYASPQYGYTYVSAKN